ncbi:hypothetical protein HZB07_05230 [Candidatus Saganbacteria bacterium]|nr:hypothetical protein [Candidatus Saganbacteria bacterium]
MIINDSQGNALQEKPTVINDGQGNYLIAWEDNRNGYTDIYVQKMTESGELLWGKDGVAACTAPGNQNSIQAISDGSGGIIVVWQDYRFYDANIYAQHIDASGLALWGKDGASVCSARTNQFAPQLASDGLGGAIITWYDYRNNAGEDIYAQRLDVNGQPLWEVDGLPVCTAVGTQWYPQISADGSGGAVIVWSDGRKGTNDNDIYAQRLDVNGQTLWTKDGTPICAASGNQEKPVVAVSEAASGVIVAWQDSRSNNVDIYSQKINLSGNAQWAKDGVAVCAFLYSQVGPKLASDGNGGAVIVWEDQREEKSDIYAQRIAGNGTISWTENGRSICGAYGEQKSPSIVKLTGDEWLIAWEDDLGQTDSMVGGNNIDIYGQKINGLGAILWDQRGLCLAAGRSLQRQPVLASASTGETIMIYEDSRNGNFDISAQKISPDAKLFWSDGLSVCAAPGKVNHQNIALADNGRGEIILTFEDARHGFTNIYAQKINKAGVLGWGREGIAAARVDGEQVKPCAVSDNKGGAYIAWEDHRFAAEPKIRMQHLSLRGERLWESSLAVADAKGGETNPLMISDNSGGVIIIWQDLRDALNLSDLYGQRVNSQGELLWGPQGKALAAENGEQVDADVIADGSGGLFLVWTDYRRGDRNPDIYAQHINNKGELLWEKTGLAVCTAPDAQRAPKIGKDGAGGIVVSWTDKGGGSYDIYAQRINKNGQLFWRADGIPVSQASRTQQNAVFGNKGILVWEDYRYGNWDIFAEALSVDGKLLWGDEGVTVSSADQTQFAPQAIPWRDGSTLIAWEDYRDGKNYDIFMQRLDSHGEPAWDLNGIKIETNDGARKLKLLAAPKDNSFYIFWEDYTNGGKAIYGQRYLLY